MDVYIEVAKPPAGIVLDVDPMTITKPFDDSQWARRVAGSR
jgi:hypothetical protein